MSTCHIQASASIELYFYGELAGAERELVEHHLTECAECRQALEELAVIRDALASRPDVSAPPGGDWSGFMARLQRALQFEAASSDYRRAATFSARRPLATVLAVAALVALVTMSVLVVVRQRGASVPPESAVSRPGTTAPDTAVVPEPTATDAALAQVSEQHFERSKLVVLGLATKDPAASSASDWDYERTLATSLLTDTRLYRLAAEERGMKQLAGVMRDLELVLLQASMSQAQDAESLAQLQRLIRRRDLLTKMEVVATTGLLP